jgi:hypothetical protein
MIPELVVATVLSVQVTSDADLPRTMALVELPDGRRLELVLPGSNGQAPVVVAGVPALMPGQTWQVELGTAAVGLVPAGLGAGMTQLAGPVAPPWNLNGVHYNDDQLPFPIYLNEEGSADLGFETSLAVFQVAIDAWNGVGCASFAFDYQGTTAAGYEDDGLNVVSWVESDWEWGDTVAGFSATRFGIVDETVGPVGADVVFNGDTWLWVEGPGDVYIARPELNAASIVLHELGHVAGLDHELVLAASTMFFAYVGGEWQGSLSGDDRRGLCEGYPTGAAECADDGDCLDIDGLLRTCVEIDGIGVCEEVWADLGAECSRTLLPCEDYCVFTNNSATEGYCSAACETASDCPSDWSCGAPELFLYDMPNVDELLCLAPDETGVDTGGAGDTQGDGGDSAGLDGDSAGTTDAGGYGGGASACGCGVAPGFGLRGALWLVGVVVWVRRRRR